MSCAIVFKARWNDNPVATYIGRPKDTYLTGEQVASSQPEAFLAKSSVKMKRPLTVFDTDTQSHRPAYVVTL